MRINLNFYFLAFISLTVILNQSYIFVLSFVSSMIHELGHMLVILYQKRTINLINVNFFNVDIVDKDRNNLNHKEDLAVLLGGPLLNFVISFVTFILNLILKNNLIYEIMYINFFIGILNLLPISSLDGGQIFSIVLSSKLDLNLSNTILNAISLIILIPVLILGFIILIKSKYNFSLLFLGLYLIYFLLLEKTS
ncbi:MAG: site-2 protease family protein [Candidatus Paraimprobicoccus trichonymphae]|uniref:Site-2 protease family protein n=1 Tax=Candidatus Paraimprobicoccus trichonymphae TaxID=3033793 RepID=A0AA48HW58_9FIRM|nr:MAG: site-2 protease family protein [Candidatus Paraimprobicoccus trichonymphae]